MKAEYIQSMNYIHWFGKPNEFGDAHFSANCYSTKEARNIIKNSGVDQVLMII